MICLILECVVGIAARCALLHQFMLLEGGVTIPMPPCLLPEPRPVGDLISKLLFRGLRVWQVNGIDENGTDILNKTPLHSSTERSKYNIFIISSLIIQPSLEQKQSFPATWTTVHNFMNKNIAVGTKFIVALWALVSSNRAYSFCDVRRHSCRKRPRARMTLGPF
jgi:hypothetical protein